jgi:alpha-1,2-mannosyltransferase
MSDSTKLPSVLFKILVALAIVRTVALSFFIVDPLRTGGSPRPFDTFYLNHNCLTAYVQGAELAHEHVDNIYAKEQYRGKFDRFILDEYYYPPQFLLFPGSLLALSSDFLDVRIGWFLFEVLAGLAGLWVLANFLDGERRRWALVAAAAFWASTPNLLTLQIGNLQSAAFALSLLAMIAFARGKAPLGGLLLAATTLAKIYPGILLVFLLFRRRYRDIGWTAAAGAVLTVLSALIYGLDPYYDFVNDMLPRIASGEAFAWLEIPQLWWVRAINSSIPGLGQKIGTLVGTLPPASVTKGLSVAFTLLLPVLAWVAAKRSTGDRVRDAQLWIALISLGALRSPFVPDTYGLIGPLWLWLLLVAEKRGQDLPKLAALFVPLAFVMPVVPLAWQNVGEPLLGPTAYILIASISQVVSLSLIAWMLFRRTPAEAPTVVHPVPVEA